MTNKHFFEEDDYKENSEIIVRNSNYTFKCKFVYMPNNLIDLAIVEIIHKINIEKLEPIKITANCNRTKETAVYN